MLRDLAPKGSRKAVRGARRLRARMTLAEIVLWHALRRSSCGLKFRRQHPSGPYILDFYCGDARLAVEVDGDVHAFPDKRRRDSKRDRWFAEQGIVTLRIAARDVLADRESAIRYILSEAVKRLPLHHPAAPGGPPPRDELGEDA